MEPNKLKVGDKIRIKNFMSDRVVEIARVTKTKAFSKPYNDGGAIYTFKLNYYDSRYITNLPKEKFSMTSYSLVTNQE